MNLKEYFEKRKSIISSMEEMVKACETETRAFSAEENEKYEKLTADLNGIDSQIEKIKKLNEQRSYNYEEPTANGTGKNETDEEIESRAFEAYIRGKIDTVEERVAKNMVPADNGAVIPTSIANKIIEKIKNISPLFAMATKYNVGGTMIIPAYDETAQRITMGYADEFKPPESSSGKFTSISLSGFLASALTLVSKSLINNSQFAIVPFVVRKMAEAAAEWIEDQLINGTPSKIDGLSKVTPSVTAKSGTEITADELIDTQEAVPDAYQAGCIWLMSKKTRTAIRKFKDNDGNYIINRDATAKWGYTLFGHDVYVSDNMPEMTTGKNAVFYLDPAALAVKIAEDPSVEVYREKYADSHAVGVMCWLEMDAKVENSQKVSLLKMAGA